jgi:hypothetical protein
MPTQPCGSSSGRWVRVIGSEAGRGVVATGETPTMGVVVAVPDRRPLDLPPRSMAFSRNAPPAWSLQEWERPRRRPLRAVLDPRMRVLGGHGNGDRRPGEGRERPVAAELVHQPSEGLVIGAARRPRQARLGEEGCSAAARVCSEVAKGTTRPVVGGPPWGIWQGRSCLNTVADRQDCPGQGHRPGGGVAGNGPFSTQGCWSLPPCRCSSDLDVDGLPGLPSPVPVSGRFAGRFRSRGAHRNGWPPPVA